MVGFALAGRDASATDPAPQTAAVAVASPTSARPSPSPTARPRPRATVPPPTVLLVHGLVPRQADDLRVRLETARGTELVVSPLDPTGHGHGGIIPFEATFTIAHRPTGADPPLFVVLVDAAGRPVGASRHAYSSSLFLDLRDVRRAGRRAAPHEPTTSGRRSPGLTTTPAGVPASRGNDGLMGGIAFGIPFAERSGAMEVDTAGK